MYGLLGPSDRSGLALQSRFEGDLYDYEIIYACSSGDANVVRVGIGAGQCAQANAQLPSAFKRRTRLELSGR